MEKYEKERSDGIREFRIPLPRRYPGEPLWRGETHVALFNVEVEAYWPRPDENTWTGHTEAGEAIYAARNTEYGEYWVVWVFAGDRARVRGENNLLPGLHSCEVCHYPLPTHQWVDMDYNGFVVQCDRQE
jgi:hypothetical protein